MWELLKKMTKSRWGVHTEDCAFSARGVGDIRSDGWNRLYELRARRLTRSLDVFFIVGDRGPNEPEPLRGFGGCERTGRVGSHSGRDEKLRRRLFKMGTLKETGVIRGFVVGREMRRCCWFVNLR